MSDPLLILHNINKHFGAFQALSDIDFTLHRGEVHCLVGENGCGKSTLIKIISGVYTPDKGAEIVIDGQPPRSRMTPQQAKAAGIHVIWQDLSLFPDLTVAENIGFDQFVAAPWRKPSRRALHEKASASLARLGLNIDPDTPLAELSIAKRQLVAIAQVLSGHARIIFMDEPTASLTRSEVNHLLDAVRRLQQEDIAIVFVSHRLAEVQEIADRVTVIRDGKKVVTRDAEGVTPASLTELMTGRAFHDEPRPPAVFDTPVLSLKDWSRAGEFDGINLTLHRGEIVGITGLLGAGRTELALSLFGMTRPDRGSLLLDGEPLHLRHNRDAINAGIAYVSEDRLNLGLIQPQSIRDNSVMAVLRQLDPSGWWLDPQRMSVHAKEWIERFQVKSQNADLPVSSLSGGNQQRIVLGKWLATAPKVLILDAPTVGVDVGAKAGIFQLVKTLAEQGLSILMISDEVGEMYYHCDRVFVMRDGQLGEAYHPHAITERSLEEAVYG